MSICLSLSLSLSSFSPCLSLFVRLHLFLFSFISLSCACALLCPYLSLSLSLSFCFSVIVFPVFIPLIHLVKYVCNGNDVQTNSKTCYNISWQLIICYLKIPPHITVLSNCTHMLFNLSTFKYVSDFYISNYQIQNIWKVRIFSGLYFPDVYLFLLLLVSWIFLVDVTVAEREQRIRAQKNRTEKWPYFFATLLILSSNFSSFFSFPIRTVEENVCNTLHQRRTHSSRD